MKITNNCDYLKIVSPIVNIAIIDLENSWLVIFIILKLACSWFKIVGRIFWVSSIG